MKFFCMDLHVSVIADFKTACPDVDVVDWCLSSHHWVMNRKQDNPEHINPQTWQHLNEDMIKRFQDKYDSFLRTFDGFIVCYCSAFAMVFEKYNKPILMMNTVRYDLPFCWTKDLQMLTAWHDCLERMTKRNQVTIVSNNLADQAYLTQATGLPSRYIPSLCLYTNTQYNPTHSTFLLYNGTIPSHPLIANLPRPHEWADIPRYRGVIHFPYEVSLMTVFEHFTAGCPLFFPSKDYWKANPTNQSVSAYWGESLPRYLSKFKTPDTWIDLADMYGVFRSPNTHYFDSIPHLFTLLETFEYVDDTEFRREHIASVKRDWSHVIRDMMSGPFWTKEPRHMCYNRLPLLANVVYDVNYAGSGVVPQHKYPYHDPVTRGDVVFVKTDMLTWFLDNRKIDEPITLVTGVSDMSPSIADAKRICAHPNIRRWIGCNITMSHPKIVKMPIGVGEPERANGNHSVLKKLHEERVPWADKTDDVCIPWVSKQNHASRIHAPTLPKLEFEEYMREISRHKFVLCPRGNGLDTHRVCETLLMGSVPVIERSGLDDMYEQWPTLLVDDTVNTRGFVWDDAKYESFLDVFWLRDALKNDFT